jgi:hypothetical protein
MNQAARLRDTAPAQRVASKSFRIRKDQRVGSAGNFFMHMAETNNGETQPALAC